jgi:hypothetical protein
MKWALGFAFAVLGCQRATPPPSDLYAQDVANICNVMELSGAKGMTGTNARYTTATWFGSHLKTEDAHRFMVQIQPLVGEAKAKALEDEAHRVGLADCALAKEWRTP